MEKFHEVLKEARKQSSFKSANDFARHAGLHIRTYSAYESGQRVPSAEVLGYIVSRSSVLPKIGERLFVLHRLALAEKSGIDLNIFERPVDVSDLAEKIGREVKYELKRYNITVTPRIERVCVRRIAMILDGALRKE
jgi:transcriptional regulator with XRE-family HTH domain